MEREIFRNPVCILKQAGYESGGRTNNAGQSISDNSPPRTARHVIRQRLHTSVRKKAEYRSLPLRVVFREGQYQLKRPGFRFAEKLKRIGSGLDGQETRFYSCAQELRHMLFNAPQRTMVDALRLGSGRHPP